VIEIFSNAQLAVSFFVSC